MTIAMTPDPLIRMTNIRKRFGPTVVLSDARLEVLPGEVHILAGENGAGKSTLIRILAGVYADWEGEIEYFGKPLRLHSTEQARRIGVSVIHQELSLVPGMTLAENLFLGRNRTRFGFLRRREQHQAALKWLGQVGLDASPEDRVEHLPLAAQQLLEIAKALSTDARVIVMDEPTSALSSTDVQRLFDLIGQLRNEGRGIVYITHKMEEIERLADRITVLRDGAWVGSSEASKLPIRELVRWMVGREVNQSAVRAPVPIGEERLRIEDFSVQSHAGRDVVRKVSLTVRRGEIVGLAGLQGSGVSELLEGLFGAGGRAARGSVWVDDQRVAIHSPRDAIRNRLALVTADRKFKGLNLEGSIVHNITLAALPRLSPGGWRRPVKEREAAGMQARALRLKSPSLGSAAWQLSGGNQQKIVLAKWLLTAPEVFLLDEPTRGVDVGAKEEIYKLIQQWTEEGMAILLNSTELPELLALSDRVIVFHRGEVTACLQRAEATPEKVLAAAMGQLRTQ